VLIHARLSALVNGWCGAIDSMRRTLRHGVLRVQRYLWGRIRAESGRGRRVRVAEGGRRMAKGEENRDYFMKLPLVKVTLAAAELRHAYGTVLHMR
jgi:hypothetical protein